MSDRATCAHMQFSANVAVARLEDHTDAGTPKRISGFMADIKIVCADCGQPFQFLGLEPGCDTQGARVSLDGLEANIAIAPQGSHPSPFQRIVYNVGKFDG